MFFSYTKFVITGKYKLWRVKWFSWFHQGPPSTPTEPFEANETSPDSITLSWNLPKDSGGLPLERFIVEKRLKNSDRWQKVSSNINPKENKTTVRNLTRGCDYDFRIVAVNELGESNPLMTSAPIRAEFPFSEQ